MGSYLTTEKHNFVKDDCNFSLFQNLREEEEEEVGGVKKMPAIAFVLEWSKRTSKSSQVKSSQIKQVSSKSEKNKKIPA